MGALAVQILDQDIRRVWFERDTVIAIDDIAVGD